LVLEKAGLDREITVTADPALLLTAVDFAKVMLLRKAFRQVRGSWGCRCASLVALLSTSMCTAIMNSWLRCPISWSAALMHMWCSYRWNVAASGTRTHPDQRALRQLAQGVHGSPSPGGELQVEPRVGVVELMTGHLSDPLQAITQRAAMQ
jgi:hypothetical protein